MGDGTGDRFGNGLFSMTGFFSIIVSAESRLLAFLCFEIRWLPNWSMDRKFEKALPLEEDASL